MDPALPALAEPRLVMRPDWLSSPPAELVDSLSAPRMAAEASLDPPAIRFLNMAHFRPAADGYAPGSVAILGPAVQAPRPVESQPAARTFSPAPAIGSPALRVPEFAIPDSSERGAAGFEYSGPPAAEPEARQPNAKPAVLEPISTISVTAPEPRVEEPAAAVIPQPGIIPLEFYCQRGVSSPARCCEWQCRAIDLRLPRLALQIIVERQPDTVLRTEVPKKAAFTEVLSMPEVAKWRRRSTGMSVAAKALAASLLVGVAMWFGAGSVQIGRHYLAGNAPSSSFEGPSGTPASGSTTTAYARPSHAAPGAPSEPAAPTGTMARLRHALSERAALVLNDTFHGPMQSWGSAPKSLATGWTRSPEGYVRPGQLALFSPTLSFTDYRMEFFGQIESKSIDWVVRAHDQRNYYAMKVTVVEPGLRPVVALVHYPVVGGQQGKRVEVPLLAMVHNDTPYHVAVDVKGNRVTTSIEGQEVDAFIDDSLRSGGIGFFSEAGERARLYWMKISRNQDWVGRVCSFLSSVAGGGTQTAELWRTPGEDTPPCPSSPHGEDLILAAAAIGPGFHTGPHRTRTSKNRRFTSWDS